MSRPTTKNELQEVSYSQFNKLFELINSMTKEDQLSTINLEGKEAHWSRDKNIRDVLIHLYEWHQLIINWVNSNQNGDPKPFLPAPYNWKNYGEMNIDFFNKHQQTDYDTSKKMLTESHKNVVTLLEMFTNDELFTKNYFSFTGNSTLGSYFVSATSSHYDWAIKKIKKHIKMNIIS